MSDEKFYSTFRDSVIGSDMIPEDDDTKSHRVNFLIHQLNMVPVGQRGLFWNIMRGYPTSPIYSFLCIGMIGTNIARFSVVRRVKGEDRNVERTGAFYNFFAPSRFGKGIALSLISEIGGHVEKCRSANFNKFLEGEIDKLQNRNRASTETCNAHCLALRPHAFFLTGGNALQTQAAAAKNSGCGLVLVQEIKSGKTAYTDHDKSYTPLLTFYDVPVRGRSFRTAEEIQTINNCRIQICAARVKEDWITFVQKSGTQSGMLARVIPVISCDRNIVRLATEKLPPYFFNLQGYKRAFEIMEKHFSSVSTDDDDPPLSIQFSRSVLNTNFRNTNNLLVNNLNHEGVANPF